MTLPASTINEGPLAQDQATFTWNGFVFGNVDSFPRAFLPLNGGVNGLRDRPDSEDNRDPATGQDGEYLYPSRLRGKPIILTGRLQALDAVSLAEHRTAFLAATASNTPGLLSIAPFVERGGVEWLTGCRVQAATCDPSITRDSNAVPSPWQHEFVCSFRQHIPTFGAVPLHTADDDDSFVATNAGTAPSDPVVTVTVASGVHDVSLYNDTTGKVLAFYGLDAASGGDLVVTFAPGQRGATIGGLPAMKYMNDLVSNWWDEGEPGLLPGDNVMRQNGGTHISVSWYDTSY